MKKVLIITYYWPPAGGAGVQRWLKFVKYLHQFGWEPIVYTAENGEVPVIDKSLLKDVPKNLTVIKRPIWEPYSIYKKLIGQKKEERINAGFLSESKKPKLMEKLSVWVRGNFFIPDARKFWIKPSIRYLTKYLAEHPVDVIVSTGPPHSMHLIALGLKEKLNLSWLADFRDPWTNIDFYDQLLLTGWADQKHKRLEKKVLSRADKIITVSWHLAEEFKNICYRDVEVVTNGYDEDDFADCNSGDVQKEFSFNHIGSLNKDRNPHVFWEALKESLTEIPDLKKFLKIRLVGKTDIEIIESIKANQLEKYFEKQDYLAHSDVIKYMCSSPILLLPLNNTPNSLGIAPGKLFEYLAAKRPILAIGKENGDAARIMNETQSGVIVDFNDKQKMKREISMMFAQYCSNQLSVNSKSIEQFSRRETSQKINGMLSKMAALKS